MEKTKAELCGPSVSHVSDVTPGDDGDDEDQDDDSAEDAASCHALGVHPVL